MKKVIIKPIYKKVTNPIYKIIALSVFYRALLKFWIRLFIIDCYTILQTIFHYLITSTDPGCSIESNLIIFWDIVTKNIDLKYQTDTIYIDLSKAFDLVPHSFLLRKLKLFGIDDTYYQFFHNYFTGRYQTVLFNGIFSDYKNILSGVYQGSCLGPFLFTIYINDLLYSLNVSYPSVNILSYADDIKIFHKIGRLDDCICLNSALCFISQWLIENGLKLNEDKTLVISYTLSKRISHSYTLDNRHIRYINV